MGNGVLTDNQKIFSFTGFRFIFIMVIVLSHFEFLGELENFGYFYKTFMHNATFGVDFFFLLSGFGMMLSNLNKVPDDEMNKPCISNSIKYGINHVKKIYPVYIATILVGLLWNICIAFYSNATLWKSIIKEFIKLIINIPLLQSSTGMMFFTHAYNGVTWFLSCLFCIYLFSPFFMYILRKISKSNLLNIIFIVLNIILIIGLTYPFEILENKISQIPHIPNLDYLVYGSPYRRIFYVLIGMNIAMIFTRIKKDCTKSKDGSLYEIVIATFVLIYFFTRKSLPAGKYKYLIDCILCTLFIFIFAFDNGCISKLMKKDFFQKYGNMAMYIFLIHYPIRIYFVSIMNKVIGFNCYIAITEVIVILVSTFVISNLVYHRKNIIKVK